MAQEKAGPTCHCPNKGASLFNRHNSSFSKISSHREFHHYRHRSCQKDELNIKCHSGATYQDLKQDLTEMHASDKKYDIVYVVAYSNDCTKQHNTSDTIAHSARAVADAALQLSQRVFLSSTHPRTDDHTAQLKAENTNTNLKRMCDKKINFL